MNDSTTIEPSSSVAELVRRQRAHFQSGATLSLQSRLDALKRLRQAIISAEKPLTDALHADLRKSPYDAFAAEMALVISDIDYLTRHLKAWMKPSRRALPWMAWPARGATVRRPLGVSLIIGPWNYPVQLLLLPLAGAIAGGNCAIVKPSELVPHTSRAVADLLSSAFPREFIACVEGDRAVAEQLLEQRFDMIFFTGGSVVGRIIAAAAARNLTPVTLELGGKCPVIVCEDANLDMAARRIIWAKHLNAGQTCVAPDYLLVQQTVRAPLIDALKREIQNMFGSDPQKSPDFGRIVNAHHHHRLSEYLKQGKILAGGQTDVSDLYMAPTLLEEVAEDAPVMQDEIFGPVLPIFSFNELSDAMKFVAAKSPPLGLYVFTTQRDIASQIGDRVPCGAICVNDLVVQLFGSRLPFGGVGESGMGKYHGKASFDCFTHEQAVVQASPSFDLPFRYPPQKLSLRWYKRLLPRMLRD